jgi:dTDP-4-amino-4,6-dideoxygalactose transaminase
VTAPKRAPEDLALFGGPAAFPETLHVGRPNLVNRERLLSRIDDMLDRRWFTNGGRYVQEFERAVATRLGVKHCIATCNATVGLELAIRAVGLRGEVIVPSMTFIATAHALQWLGITPIFCDVDPETFTIDPDRAESLISPRTTGILAVHLWGRPADVDALDELCARRNLRLLYDSAHAFGCTSRGRGLGVFGDAEVFSFHATKFLNSFEGGAITTNDDALAATLRLMKNFGFSDYDTVVALGVNGKMTEVSAAMGLTSLEGLDEIIMANRLNYEWYLRELEDLPGSRVLPYDDKERNNYQYVVVDVDAAETGIDRDQIMRILWAENVRARRYFYPGCHRMEPYRSTMPNIGQRLPVTERILGRVLTLPTGMALGPSEVSRVCELFRFIVRNGSTIAARLREPDPEH